MLILLSRQNQWPKFNLCSTSCGRITDILQQLTILVQCGIRKSNAYIAYSTDSCWLCVLKMFFVSARQTSMLSVKRLHWFCCVYRNLYVVFVSIFPLIKPPSPVCLLESRRTVSNFAQKLLVITVSAVGQSSLNSHTKNTIILAIYDPETPQNATTEIMGIVNYNSGLQALSFFEVQRNRCAEWSCSEA